jgi:hypothetical protein
MDINIFVDANHAHDKVTGRSAVTGLFALSAVHQYHGDQKDKQVSRHLVQSLPRLRK